MRMFRLLGGSVLGAVLGASIVSADTISLNFSQNEGNQVFAGAQLIGPLKSDSATWNSSNPPRDSGDLVSGTKSGLVDDTGADTGVHVTWDSSGTEWNNDGTSNDENKLAVGFLDDGDPGVLITFSNVPYAVYRVYGLLTSHRTGPSPYPARDFNVNGVWAYGSDGSGTRSSYPDIADNDAVHNEFWTETTDTVTGNFWTVETSGSTLTVDGQPENAGERGTLAGLIIKELRPVDQQPVIAPSGTLFVGTTVTITVVAEGSNPTYQWYKGATALTGETSAVLTFASVAVTDAGDYSVEVTSSLGTETSDTVTLTVSGLSTPVITEAPVSQSLYQGYPATFSASATGGELSYQWKSDTVAIPGETNTTYTIANISTTDAATYSVEVSNPVGSASASATLTVKVPTGVYETTMVNTKPLLWFRYSESGAVAQDAAANIGSVGATGTGLYVGNSTHPVAGALVGSSDQAAEFSGGRVAVPHAASLNPATFTIEAWLKPAVAHTGGTLTDPLASMQVANPREGWNFYQSASGWNFRTYNQNGTTPAVNITGGPAPVAGQWYHVVGTWDGSVGRVYVDGVLSATSGATNFVANPSAAFTVGARSDGAFAWNGVADEVAYYATALSDAQILAHYQNGTNASPATPYDTLVLGDAPVEYLRLNDTFSLSPAANDGTLGHAWTGTYNDAGGVPGAPSIAKGSAGPRPAAYAGFEADNTSVVMTNGYATSPMLPLNTNTVTMTCWLKPETVPTSGDIGFPAWLGDGGMHIENSAGRPQRELRYHWAGTGAWGWGSGLQVPADTWTFCAMVIEPDRATFYMSDGGILRESVRTAQHPPMNITSPPGFGGNQPGRADRTYIGEIDETTVYDRALSPAEINGLYTLATGDLGPNIEDQPQDAELVLGDLNEDITFSVQASGLTPLSYQWKFDGGDIPQATDATLVISNAAPTDVGTYTVSVSNVATTVLSDPAELTLVSGPVSPTQLTTLEGDNVAFTVAMPADSTGYLYQWRDDSGIIPMATNDTFELTGVAPEDSGTFTVEVTLGPDMVTSDPVSLTVLPVATEDYASIVTGETGVLAYWRLGETNGATVAVDEIGGFHGAILLDPTLELPGALLGEPNTSAAFPGSSQVEVDETGLVPVELTTPQFTVEFWALSSGGSGVRSPISMREVDAGLQWGWTFYATGDNQWGFDSFDGTTGPGNSILGPAVVQGQWAHVVGTHDGMDMKFYVNGGLVGTVANASYDELVFNAPLRIGAGGAGSELWVGQVDEVSLYDRALTLSDVQDHFVASFGVGAGPEITQDPLPFNWVRSGEDTALVAGASGLPPLDYQWQKDMVDIPDAIDPTLDIVGATEADAGLYRCVVTNPYGTNTTTDGELHIYSGLPLADGVSVNFWRDDSANTQVLFSAEVAGFFPLANWNNAVVPGTNASGHGVQPLIPIDQDGAATTMDVRWSSAAAWSAGTAPTTPDEKLGWGYLDDNDTPAGNLHPNNDGGVAGDGVGVSITVSNIPYSTYAVVLYLNSDSPDTESFGSYEVNGVSQTGGATMDFGEYGNQWIEGENLLLYFTRGSTLRIRVAPRLPGQRGSLAGFQIMDAFSEVVPAKSITSFWIDPVGGTYFLSWDSVSGTVYQVESESDLENGPWGDEAGSTVTATNDTSTWAAPATGDNNNYRVIENPSP